ncbi:MAG: sulfite reductase flavoprotein subunit alpha [Pseudomonadota bacterium]
MNILFGSVTGTAENVARNAAKMARARGHDVNLTELDEVTMEDLEEMDDVLVVIATYGEGEMPFNAETFWDELEFNEPPLDGLTYGVLALGDTAYEQFCQAGKDIDQKLEELGATRRLRRVDCDLNYERDAEAWIDQAIPKKKGAPAEAAAPLPEPEPAPEPEVKRWTREAPFPAKLISNTRLSGPGSDKQIHHISLDISGSGLTYAAGDAIGVIPHNSAALVDAMLARLGATAADVVEGYDLTLGDLLRRKFEIFSPPMEFVRAVSSVITHPELNDITAKNSKAAIDEFCWGKDVIDILNCDPRLVVDADILLSLLKPLQHRAYSIASTPATAPDRIDLTVAAVRWSERDRDYNGVASTMLCDLTEPGATVDLFMVPNKRFRLPDDPATPMIMVGPGTGIAPFIGFLEERQAQQASGQTWLYFGDRHERDDFIYRDTLSGLQSSGALTHLRTAFSRDSADKVYVQHRMREDADALFAAFEAGAAFYLCGDAKRMAPDVEQTVLDIVARGLGSDMKSAARYVADMRVAGRYCKDVY